MQVEQFLEDSARCLPDKVGLVCGDQRYTYSQLDETANRLARALLAAGIKRGDRVAIYLQNSFEAVVAIFAILKAGAVFIPVNPGTKARKLSFILNNSRAAALIADGARLEVLNEIADTTPHTHAVIVAGSTHLPLTAQQVSLERLVDPGTVDGAKPPTRTIDIDLAAIIYTSGSTGSPKGVMLTHLNIVAAATSITTFLQNTSDDVIVNVLPLSFDYGLYQVLMGFKIGGTVVLERSFAYPHAVLEKIVSEGVTGFPIVPTMSAMLLQMDLAQYDLSRVRYLTSTAAALPPSHVLALRARFPHVKIYSMYGLTECKRVSYLPPDEIESRTASVGKGMPNEEVYLVDEAGKRIVCGVGELVVRGSNIMKGYWELPAETAQVLRPGPLPGERVLHTGDIFRMDEDGYLYFLARKDDMIKSRGEKVSPREVENVLYELPAIAEAVVLGVDDDILGQAIKAVVTLKEGTTLTSQDVQRHCAHRLESFMVPKVVEFRTLLPKTASGKIDRKMLQPASH